MEKIIKEIKVKLRVILRDMSILDFPKNVIEENIESISHIWLVLKCTREVIFMHSKYEKEDENCVDCITDKVWERLNVGKWQDVPLCLRDLYSYCCLLKGIVLLKFIFEDTDCNIKTNLQKIVKTLDFGLMLGSSFHKEFSQVAHVLCTLIKLIPDEKKFSSYPLLSGITDCMNMKDSIVCLACPSIETFFNDYFSKYVPVKIKGYINYWPAIKKWQDIRFILETMGPRTVPVEIGSSYTSSNWSQKLMTVQFFIENFIMNSKSNKIGYLAQHQLFNQIPELLQDIKEPEYCTLSENYDNCDSECYTDINIWFGPSNTVSPLHYDPRHNLFAQVVGTKRLFLINPKWSDHVYPYEDNLLFNTAQVDPENPDYEKFPKFKDVELLQCTLEAGDLLYIPPKWWHHVRSYSTSISVSFWFGNTSS